MEVVAGVATERSARFVVPPVAAPTPPETARSSGANPLRFEPPRFYASVTTLSSGELKRLTSLWGKRGTAALFSGVLTVPLFARRSTLDILRERAGQWSVLFDSGGYYVQQGIVSYSDLCTALLNSYIQNQWASQVLLPDCVPTSSDDSSTVNSKVLATIRGSLIFHKKLPELLQNKAIPVVQGHTTDHIARCLDAYLDAGFRLIAFGGFDTSGRRQSVNRLTHGALRRFAYLAARARRDGFRIHALGVGNPPTVAVLSILGVESFDSSAWIRTAGHGNIYMPHSSEAHITGRSPGRPLLSSSAFRGRGRATKHTCRFCTSFRLLRAERYRRALHNLVVLQETLRCRHQRARLQRFAPRYSRMIAALGTLPVRPQLEIAKATVEDLDEVKRLADANRDALGFVPRAALAVSVAQQEVMVARLGGIVAGFQSYHHRKRDQVTKLYFKCVAQHCRRRGIGRRLVDAVVTESRRLGRTKLALKCPVGLPSNGFHERYGFVLVHTAPGRRRHLNVWEYQL